MFARLTSLFGRRQPASSERPSGARPASRPGPPCDPELPLNPMLAHIIAGRTVRAVAQDGTLASVTFADGSVMKIKSGAPAPVDALIGKTVQNVRQGGLCLELLFQDDSMAAVTLAEETSSVLLRDAQGAFEYAD
jgi:hypothetical protein